MTAKIWQRLRLCGLGWLLSYPIVLHLSLSSVIARPIKFKLPPPPPRGIAGSRSAAASRDTCPTVDRPLTALVPKYREQDGDRVWGLTGMERPTLWFYMPYAKNAIVDMSFTLQDESNPAATKIIYQNSQLVPAQLPGVMKVVLPKSIAPLATTKPYHWFLTLNMVCTSGQRPIFVDGWVQRIEIDRQLRDRIERATPIERVVLAAENGLWYDALTTLANLRALNPQDATLFQSWQNLLATIELGHLATQTFSENKRSKQSQQSMMFE
jgi:hypothetical protein